jgi:hypothetical protein
VSSFTVTAQPRAATREVKNLQVGHGPPVMEEDKLTWAQVGYAEETAGSPTDRKRTQPNGSNQSRPAALPTICARDRPERQPSAPRPRRRSPSSPCASAAGGCRSSGTALLLARVFLYSETVPVYSFAVDLERLCAEDSCFLPDAGSIGVEFVDSSAANGSLGLIRVLLRAIFLLAPCARVEFRNVGQQKEGCVFVYSV